MKVRKRLYTFTGPTQKQQKNARIWGRQAQWLHFHAKQIAARLQAELPVPSIHFNLPISLASTETARHCEQGHDDLCPTLQMAASDTAEIILQRGGGFCIGQRGCDPRRDQRRNNWKATRFHVGFVIVWTCSSPGYRLSRSGAYT